MEYLNSKLELNIVLLSMGFASGGRGHVPAVKTLGGRPTGFESEVAQIRCLSIFRVFWGRLATLLTISSLTQKTVATLLFVSENMQGKTKHKNVIQIRL